MTASGPIEKIMFPCSGCGANLEFAPGLGALKCPHCGNQQRIDQPFAKPIIEYSFAEARAQAARVPAHSLVPSGKEVECDGCGARTTLTGTASRCPFCDSPVVLVETPDEVFVPKSLLPLRVERKAAVELFKNWVSRRWFAPNDLALRAERDEINGVFLPYWTYDSITTTHYSGQRGTHYWVSESYTDAQGKAQTRKVMKTRWAFTSGVVRVPFDDVLVPATRSLAAKLVNALEPWDLPELVPYDPGFLAGYQAERYGIDLEEGFSLAENRMDEHIRAAICRDIGGDAQLILGMRVQHRNVTFKHILLPLWIASYRYRNRVFRFLVNARTGEAHGERPYSVIKIVLAAVLALVIISGVLWWTQQT